MDTNIRDNERSWAIEMISDINILLATMNLKIKRAGGENTISNNKKSMFPDVLLYADENRTSILQGWELKMPDVQITDIEFIENAKTKARLLSLNSFIAWNFSYGKLYLKDSLGEFYEAKVWNETSYIKTREEVERYKPEWTKVIKEIIVLINNYFINGDILTAALSDVLTENIMSTIIEKNKVILARNYQEESSKNMLVNKYIDNWWLKYKEEYVSDELDKFTSYSKNVLLNWINRIMFANIIKMYHSSARLVETITCSKTPIEGNIIMESIIEQGNFYNVFHGEKFSELLPLETWLNIIDFNMFLMDNNINVIDHSVYQDILEKTVNISKREVRGQFTTPKWLADFLCQLTINDWTGHCADFCSGTGTIAKAILDNKKLMNCNINDRLKTTWISDKYAYPLQISNISLTSIEAINIPINLFKKNVFELRNKDEIIIKSPIDGTDIKKELPELDAIVSNLPFVAGQEIAKDDVENMNEIFAKVNMATNLNIQAGRMDLYMAIPFKIYELLSENGKLGIIVSNSWLGSKAGKNFYNALTYYYNIENVIISGEGRWFENAKVVVTIIVLSKKTISKPSPNDKIQFCLINKDMKLIDKDAYHSIINSIVLKENTIDAPIHLSNWSLEEINNIQNKGLCLNSLFHNIEWLDKFNDKLIPINEIFKVGRGERRGWNDLFYPSNNHSIEREYIKRVLKNPEHLTNYRAETDIDAFCCHESEQTLKAKDHIGALNWIKRFEGLKNGKGEPLPLVLRQRDRNWYEMDDASKTDFVAILNPSERLFVAMFDEPTFVDQRFIKLNILDYRFNKKLLHALLNSIFEMFVIEGTGFGRGLGVLDVTSENFNSTYMINPNLINDNDATQIIQLFETVEKRGVMSTKEELNSYDREMFDRAVLRSIGIEDQYEKIKNSLLSMQDSRLSVQK